MTVFAWALRPRSITRRNNQENAIEFHENEHSNQEIELQLNQQILAEKDPPSNALDLHSRGAPEPPRPNCRTPIRNTLFEHDTDMFNSECSDFIYFWNVITGSQQQDKKWFGIGANHWRCVLAIRFATVCADFETRFSKTSKKWFQKFRLWLFSISLQFPKQSIWNDLKFNWKNELWRNLGH